MSSVRRGEIFTANIPMPSGFFKKSKVRPVLIIQNDELNRKREDVIIIPISSNLKHAVEASNYVFKDFAALGLKVKSVVICASILTIPKALPGQRLGQTSDSEMNAILQKIVVCLS